MATEVRNGVCFVLHTANEDEGGVAYEAAYFPEWMAMEVPDGDTVFPFDVNVLDDRELIVQLIKMYKEISLMYFFVSGALSEMIPLRNAIAQSILTGYSLEFQRKTYGEMDGHPLQSFNVDSNLTLLTFRRGNAY